MLNLLSPIMTLLDPFRPIFHEYTWDKVQVLCRLHNPKCLNYQNLSSCGWSILLLMPPDCTKSR